MSRDAPLLAERLVDAINSDRQIEVHVWGSMGQSDMTMEVVGLCKPIAGVELMVAAQATQSRKATPLGAVTGKLFALVREAVPFAAASDRVLHLDPLLRHVEARCDEIGALIGADD